MSTFDSTKLGLQSLITDITVGKLQLPDFQRGWVWNDEHVRSLLVSIARSFPVGAVMLLESGGEVKFQVRPIENVSFTGPVPLPEKLILDGQQRLTTLTQVLALNKPVKTFDEKKKPIERYYYIDIEKALNPDLIDDAFFAVESDRKIKKNFGRDVVLDLSAPELECQNLCFPCNQILNSDSWEESLQEHASDKFPIYMKFRKLVLNAFRTYMMPVIALGKTTSKEAVCLVFEKVNTGGVQLSVFELVTATFAADNFNLRDDWYGSKERNVTGRYLKLKAERILTSTAPTDFLQAISLLHTYERRLQDQADGKVGKSAAAVSAKRVTILSLRLADYQKWAEKVEHGYMLAAKFLRKECFFTEWDLPYRTQIVPLATVLALLGSRWLEPKIHEKLKRWFWCGILGELYGGAVETRVANDLEDLMAWINGSEAEPRTVKEAAFHPQRLLTLRTRNSAAYKGLHVLVLRNGCKDFFWKANIQELQAENTGIDIHHVFPRKWCSDQKIDMRVCNSIINKTPISFKANRMIGGSAPSAYLKQLQSHKQVQASDADMDELLRSHHIEPTALRTDDFSKFFEERKNALLTLIEKAIGKALLPPAGSVDEPDEDDGEDEGVESEVNETLTEV